jgi:hypothetical protein
MYKSSFALTLLAFFAVTTSAQNGIFTSTEFGFSMLEPQGWTLAEKRVLDENVKQLDISTAAMDRRAAKENVLLFAFTKYVPNSRRGLNPKIEARVIATGLQRSLSFGEFQPAIIKAFQTLSGNHKSYSYLLEPTPIEVFGGKGVYQISRFTMRTKDRTEYYVRSRTYAIPYKTYYFQISFVDEVGGEDCSALFDELVKSIKIGNYL